MTSLRTVFSRGAYRALGVLVFSFVVGAAAHALEEQFPHAQLTTTPSRRERRGWSTESDVPRRATTAKPTVASWTATETGRGNASPAT